MRRKVAVPENATDSNDTPIFRQLEENVDHLRQLWPSSDLVCKFETIGGHRCVLAAVETLMDDPEVRRITSAMKAMDWGTADPEIIADIDPMHCSKVSGFVDVFKGLCAGALLVFTENYSFAMMCEVVDDETRSIDRPELEPTILGPQVGFVESWKTNISLIRRRIKSSQLTIKYFDLGRLTQTRIVLLYMTNVIKPSLIEEVTKRLNRIDLDAVLDANYIIETMSDAPRSLFPTMQSTERCDRTVAAILQGKLAIVVDGSPICAIAPVVFFDLLESAEDYYSSYMVVAPLRVLRHGSFWGSVFAPAIYIALMSFQQEMIPTRLLLSLQNSHEGIPFPTVIEAFIMVLIFETLQEAGIRLPRAVGQSVSILGTLIIGDAAVNAGIVSPGMVIVVAMTGIWTFSIPTYTLTFTARLLRYPAMICAALFGLTGLAIYALMLLTHMVSLRSFGIPYVSIASSSQFKTWLSALLRRPLFGHHTITQSGESQKRVVGRTPMPRPRRRKPTR